MKKQLYLPISVSALALMVAGCTSSPPAQASAPDDQAIPLASQQENPSPAVMGGGGGGGRRGGPLVMRDDVQKELGLSDEQMAEIEGLLGESEGEAPANGASEWEDVMDGGQRARYRELSLQRAGLRALAQDDVAKELGLSTKQAAAIEEAIEAGRPQRGEGGFDRESFMKLREEMNEKIMDVLTDAQKAKWEGMLGDEFEFQRRQPGPGAGMATAPR